MSTTITTVAPRKVQWNLPEPPKVRMRDQFADWMRAKNYARNTITAYVADVRDKVTGRAGYGEAWTDLVSIRDVVRRLRVILKECNV